MVASATVEHEARRSKRSMSTGSFVNSIGTVLESVGEKYFSTVKDVAVRVRGGGAESYSEPYRRRFGRGCAVSATPWRASSFVLAQLTHRFGWSSATSLIDYRQSSNASINSRTELGRDGLVADPADGADGGSELLEVVIAAVAAVPADSRC